MEFWKIILGLAVRKVVGPPLVALSLVVGAVAYYVMPTHYKSNVLMVLTTSAKGVSTDPTKQTGLTNPLLQFSDGLKTTASIIIQSMNTPEVRKAVGAPKDGPVALTVDDGRTDPDLLDISGPYIYVAVDATSADVAKTVAANTYARIGEELDSRQRLLGAPRSTFIMVADVVPISDPVAVTRTRWQVALGAFVLCLALSFGIAYGRARAKALKARGPRVPVPVNPDWMSGWPEREDEFLAVDWQPTPAERRPPMLPAGKQPVRADEEPVERTDGFKAHRLDDREDIEDDDTMVIILPRKVTEGDTQAARKRAAQNGAASDDLTG
jgi:hypothetical protein